MKLVRDCKGTEGTSMSISGLDGGGGRFIYGACFDIIDYDTSFSSSITSI